MLLFVVASAVSSLPAQQHPSVSSGHHYSFLEGAQIGHDFGRNPFVRSSRDAASLGFTTDFGGSRLDQALARAVAAVGTRMSFDLEFDLRSIVVFENGLAVSLDSVDAFLTALDQADANPQKEGRRFGADVVLVEHAVADGVSQEGAFSVGGHPELITDSSARAQWLEVMTEVLVRLVSYDRASISLMNEPEFVSTSTLDAAQRIQSARLGEVRLVEGSGGFRKITTGRTAARLLEAIRAVIFE